MPRLIHSKKLLTEIIQQITLPEPPDEIKALAFAILHHQFGLSLSDILAGKQMEVTSEKEKRVLSFIERLNLHEPIQYILSEADFAGRKFLVNPSVLIPRPETEELVRIASGHLSNISKKELRILDIGTGSGCIAITLALEFPLASVSATEISADALAVARQNAQQLNATVNFIRHDVLTEAIPVQELDLIIGNPPYVRQEEKVSMNRNVLDFEPHQALFVPDDDPLVFYRAIAQQAGRVLKKNGFVAVEINTGYGLPTAEIFRNRNFREVHIIQDISGKDRMIIAKA